MILDHGQFRASKTQWKVFPSWSFLIALPQHTAVSHRTLVQFWGFGVCVYVCVCVIYDGFLEIQLLYRLSPNGAVFDRAVSTMIRCSSETSGGLKYRVGGVVECFLADAETKHNTGSGWSSFHFLFITIGWLLSEDIRWEESCCFRQHNAGSFRFHLHTRERHPNQFALEVDRIKRNKYVLLTWGLTAILDQNNAITTIIS